MFWQLRVTWMTLRFDNLCPNRGPDRKVLGEWSSTNSCNSFHHLQWFRRGSIRHPSANRHEGQLLKAMDSDRIRSQICFWNDIDIFCSQCELWNSMLNFGCLASSFVANQLSVCFWDSQWDCLCRVTPTMLTLLRGPRFLTALLGQGMPQGSNGSSANVRVYCSWFWPRSYPQIFLGFPWTTT